MYRKNSIFFHFFLLSIFLTLINVISCNENNEEIPETLDPHPREIYDEILSSELELEHEIINEQADQPGSGERFIAVHVNKMGATEQLNPKLVGLSNMAIKFLPKNYKFLNIISATREVITGVRYNIIADVLDDNDENVICELKIMEKPWIIIEWGEKYRLLEYTNCSTGDTGNYGIISNGNDFNFNPNFVNGRSSVSDEMLKELEAQIIKPKSKSKSTTSTTEKNIDENIAEPFDDIINDEILKELEKIIIKPKMEGNFVRNYDGSGTKNYSPQKSFTYSEYPIVKLMPEPGTKAKNVYDIPYLSQSAEDALGVLYKYSHKDEDQVKSIPSSNQIDQSIINTSEKDINELPAGTSTTESSNIDTLQNDTFYIKNIEISSPSIISDNNYQKDDHVEITTETVNNVQIESDLPDDIPEQIDFSEKINLDNDQDTVQFEVEPTTPQILSTFLNTSNPENDLPKNFDQIIDVTNDTSIDNADNIDQSRIALDNVNKSIGENDPNAELIEQFIKDLVKTELLKDIFEIIYLEIDIQFIESSDEPIDNDNIKKLSINSKGIFQLPDLQIRNKRRSSRDSKDSSDSSDSSKSSSSEEKDKTESKSSASSSSSSSSSSDESSSAEKKKSVTIKKKLKNTNIYFGTICGSSIDNDFKETVLKFLEKEKFVIYSDVIYVIKLIDLNNCNSNLSKRINILNVRPTEICTAQAKSISNDLKILKKHCTLHKRERRQIVGAPISADNDDGIEKLVKDSLDGLKAQGGNNPSYSFVRVLNATKQVVAGVRYRINVELKLDDNNVEQCFLDIWDRPWIKVDGREVTMKCGENKKYNFRQRRSLRTGQSERINNIDNEEMENLFQKFKLKHRRNYKSSFENEMRFNIFKENLLKIQHLNEFEQGTARYGITQFTDYTVEEFKQKTGLLPKKRHENEIKNIVANIPDIELPKQFDWREKGAVTEVKDQGSCGSCWAFSVTGNIEGLHAIKYGMLQEYSEQELIDCDTIDSGCNGGLPDNAYKAIEQLGGLELENEYPYHAKKSSCTFNKTMSRVQITGAVDLPKNETKIAQYLIQNGPLSVGINANAMQFYRGGISHPWRPLCLHSKLDHGVLIVGYGVAEYPLFNKTLPYWTIKNSWGPKWGEQGYYRVFRGDNTCGVSSMVSSAIVA